MSAKSAIKLFVNNDQENSLYRWVSFLTGSKNTLKGVGFFLGAVLLSWLGFWITVVVLCVLLCSAWLISLVFLKAELGISKQKAKFTDIFSKSPAINCLSAARLFLFAARDVWFVVALPVYLAMELGWSHGQVGSFLAAWIIGYGFVQTITPVITGKHSPYHHQRQALVWALLLAALPALIAATMHTAGHAQTILITGLLLFGGVFAVNSALHSYLIISFADRDGVSLDVGFYYMANAMGRLCGTVLSGWLFQRYGLAACLWVASAITLASAGFALLLPYTREKTRL